LGFIEFFLRMAPVTMPVLVCGLITCVLPEKLKWFGYDPELPEAVASVLAEYDKEQDAKRDSKMNAILITQALVGIVLILSLAFHVTSVGLVWFGWFDGHRIAKRI
jgi:NhaB family Na+:H+ antiporter